MSEREVVIKSGPLFTFNPTPVQGRAFVTGERIRIVAGGKERVVTVDTVSEDGHTLTVTEVVGGE